MSYYCFSLFVCGSYAVFCTRPRYSMALDIKALRLKISTLHTTATNKVDGSVDEPDPWKVYNTIEIFV